MLNREQFEKTRVRFKELLKSKNLKNAFGDTLRPLIIGCLYDFFKDDVIGRRIVFAYEDDEGKIDIIDYDPKHKEHVCEVCYKFREELGGEKYCRKSSINAAEKLIGKKNIVATDTFDGFSRIDSDNSHIGFSFQCDGLGFSEWIIPLSISGVCVGAFITGQIYTGDPNRFAEEIHSNLPGEIAAKFPIKEIKKFDFPNPIPSKDYIDNIFNKIAEIQNDIQDDYENELARYEKLVLGHLTSIVEGGGSEYNLDSHGDAIQDQFKFARILLYDSIIVLQDIFDIKEAVIFTSNINDNETPSRLSGELIMNEQEKQSNIDGLEYDRAFFESFQYLNVNKFKINYKTIPDNNSLFAHLIVKNNDCCKYFTANEGLKEKITSSDNCPCLREGYVCAYLNSKKNCLGYKKACTCPYLLTHPILPDASDFSDCRLLIYAAKNNMDYPVAFFIRFSDSIAEDDEERIESFFERLGTLFLTQWNTLLAEQNRKNVQDNIMYLRHEIREMINAQNGISRKIENIYHKTIPKEARDVSISFPYLPPAVLALLQYIGDIFFEDYEAIIQNLNDIVENYNILTEKIQLTYAYNFSMRDLLNAIPPAIKNMSEFSSHWLERKNGWQYCMPQNADVDHGKLSQAMRNLIRNAQKYSYDNTNILLDYGYAPDDKTKLLFSVTSFSANIPDDEKEKIFEQGYRGKQHVGEQEPGRGLGLYVARRIAKLHGGNLELNECIKISSLNVPLLKQYKTFFETHDEQWRKVKGFDVDTYNQCLEEIKQLGEEKLCEITYDTEPRQGSTMSHKTRYLLGEIKKATYRNTFTLCIPIRKER
jgi:signal transduction histidine kinase